MVARVCTHPWELRVEPFRIIGNLYYVGNLDSSSHLIDTGDGLILIDTAFPQTVYLLLESVRRLGFDPDDIKYVVHTHAHYDHFGGTKAIVELTGAKTFLGKEDIEILTDHPELSWTPEYGVEFYETFDVDTPLSDGDTISLGNTTIECVHIPGHTPGSISYFFEVTEEGKSYRAGIHGGPGLNTLSDEYLAQYGLSESRREDYRRSLQKLKKEKVDVFIGAHPDQSDTFEKLAKRTDENNTFINTNDFRIFLEGIEEMITHGWSWNGDFVDKRKEAEQAR